MSKILTILKKKIQRKYASLNTLKSRISTCIRFRPRYKLVHQVGQKLIKCIFIVSNMAKEAWAKILQLDHCYSYGCYLSHTRIQLISARLSEAVSMMNIIAVNTKKLRICWIVYHCFLDAIASLSLSVGQSVSVW